MTRVMKIVLIISYELKNIFKLYFLHIFHAHSTNFNFPLTLPTNGMVALGILYVVAKATSQIGCNTRC